MSVDISRKPARGFTLIELIVVISLISLMFSFSAPRIYNAVFVSDSDRTSRWIIGKVQSLKEMSARERKLYVLHVSLGNGRLWISNESMSEADLETAAAGGIEIPEEIRLLDVEFAGKGKISVGQADICFYREGYSDKVLLHFQEGEGEFLTFAIEPFLPRVKRIDRYAGFDS